MCGGIGYPGGCLHFWLCDRSISSGVEALKEQDLKILALDEADEMLSPGLEEPMCEVFNNPLNEVHVCA